MTQSFESIIPLLQNSGVGVLPTDTLYGVVGLALNPQSVERIYTVKERNTNKPLIVLISDLSDLSQFGIDLTPQTSEMLNRYWPGPVSIILLCMDEQFTYLHRRTNSLAFRLPNNPQLISLIHQAGPLVAPSANPEGQPPAQTIAEAQHYFGNQVDFYVNGGTLNNPPSTILQFNEKGEIIKLR